MDQKTLMEKEMVENNLNNKHIISFHKHKYEMTTNFAYLNSELDKIFKKYKIKYDEKFMMITKLNRNNYTSKMTEYIKMMYDNNEEATVVNDIIKDIQDLFNKIVMMLDSGNRISLDLNLLHICREMKKNKKLEELMMTEYINKDMDMVTVFKTRQDLSKKFREFYIPGVTELLDSGYGIKEGQLFNILFFRGLRLRIHNMKEISPYVAQTRWLDGMSEYDDWFIESNVNRKSVIISKEKIKDTGQKIKEYNIAAQDTTINSIDCGTKRLIDITIKDQKDLMRYQRKLYLNQSTNQLEEITDKHTHLINVPIKMRSLYTCRDKSGICATCFGTNASWNISNDYYRKDPGTDAIKTSVGPVCQEVLGVKHAANPNMIMPEFMIVDINTGEMTYELHDLFDTTQSRLILKDPKRYSLQITEDLIIDPADIEHFDTEFNEYDNNRLKHIIIVDNKTNKSYLFTNNSPFIIKGEPFNSLHPPVIAGVLDITSNPLSYVVLNKSSIGTYDALEKFDTNDEITTIDQLIEGMNTIFHYESFIKVELLSHMKIRSKINPSRKPDFNHEEEYLIYSIRKTDNALASVSLRLSIGKIPEILTDPKNHNPKNLKPTTYDYVYEDPKEDLI